MTAASAALDAAKSHDRSRVSNGTAILPGVDGRSTWVRRLRDLIALHLSDLGGEDATSEAERSIVRRIATLTVELERMESRLLESIGLKRVPRDVTPSVADYVAHIAKEEVSAA